MYDFVYIVSKNTLFLNVLKKYFHARPCQQTLFALNMSAQDLASNSFSKYSKHRNSRKSLIGKVQKK